MKKTVGLGSVLFPLLLWSCGGGDSPTTPTTPTPTPTPVATSITISEANLSFASLGDTTQLSATVKDQNGATMAGVTVAWATSKDAVATVSSTGLAFGTSTPLQRRSPKIIW